MKTKTDDFKNTLDIIGYIHTEFPEKFGIPRQSGLVPELEGVISFEPKYRNPEAFKGLEGYDYIWLLWKFQNGKKNAEFQATVKPPRLGGNTHMGVFATRSPFRPNEIGLSSVRLKRVEFTEQGPLLYVSGADLRDMTPILDIKPYLPYSDCHPDARAGFADLVYEKELQVVFPEELLRQFPEEKQAAILAVLKQDPRPSYQTDENRKYGVSFWKYDVHFTVKDNVLTVFEVVKL